MKEQPREPGFKLTELVIIVAVLGMVATMSLPNLLNANAAAERKSAVVALHPFDTVEEAEPRPVFVSGSTTDFDCDHLYTVDSFVEWPEGLET